MHDRCDNPHNLVTDHQICGHNIANTAHYWAVMHMELLFVLVLIAIAVCTFAANSGKRKGNPNPLPNNDMNYHLQNITNALTRLENK